MYFWVFGCVSTPLLHLPTPGELLITGLVNQRMEERPNGSVGSSSQEPWQRSCQRWKRTIFLCYLAWPHLPPQKRCGFPVSPKTLELWDLAQVKCGTKKPSVTTNTPVARTKAKPESGCSLRIPNQTQTVFCQGTVPCALGTGSSPCSPRKGVALVLPQPAQRHCWLSNWTCDWRFWSSREWETLVMNTVRHQSTMSNGPCNPVGGLRW